LSELRFPPAGVLRIAPDPARLPSEPRGGEPGPNRFDDPEGRFVVRYLAESLRGCLIELLARFRRNEAAEARVAAVVGAKDDSGHPGAEALADWLPRQRVAVCRLVEPTGPLLDVNDVKLLVELDADPGVRAVLQASGLGTPEDPARLDEGTIRLRGGVGRSTTQAVSRALYERDPRPAGLAYRSRLDDAERCWALYGETPVRFEPSVALSAEDASHLEAVRVVAALYDLPLPAPWKVG
jgi:hypothetical protein